MRLGYWACAAAVDASHPKRNRNTAGAIEVVPLRILAPCRNQYAMLRANFAEPCLREKMGARVDFAAGGNGMNRGFGTAVAVLFALHAALAHAQEAWPARPVKFIVPSSPGGGTDLYARQLAQALSESLSSSSSWTTGQVRAATSAPKQRRSRRPTATPFSSRRTPRSRPTRACTRTSPTTPSATLRQSRGVWSRRS